jgi:hypothetical protein
MIGTKLAAMLAIASTLSTAAAQAQTSSAPPPPAPLAPPAPASPAPVKEGSLYVQCDGNPNNMAAGESVARLIGAVTLLGIFAPAPEQPDASKRKFGAAGVAACDGILNGEKAEHNVVRRLPLILARALHRIEAKDYQAAIADVGLARNEAKAANLVGNIYFDRSLGLSFDLIESQALIRAGKIDEARAINARSGALSPHSYYPLLTVRPLYAFGGPPVLPAEEAALRNLSRISPGSVFDLASRLDEAGRFAESAAALRALDQFQATAYHDDNSDGVSLLLSTNLAISYALANDWPNAEQFGQRSDTMLSSLRANGKEVKNEALLVERMDLYAILRMTKEGKLVEARRQFAARSRWTAPTFGQVLAVNRLLRPGASSSELFGSLEKDADALVEQRRKEVTARLLELDKNNKTLFTYILPYSNVQAYERLSGQVWKTKGSRIIAKEKRDKSDVYLLSIFDAGDTSPPDALLLHAALQAKARGVSGLVFRLIPDEPRIAFVYFTNRNAPGIADEQYLDADAVIADLRRIIPSPEELKARQAARSKAPS